MRGASISRSNVTIVSAALLPASLTWYDYSPALGYATLHWCQPLPRLVSVVLWGSSKLTGPKALPLLVHNCSGIQSLFEVQRKLTGGASVLSRSYAQKSEMV